MVLVKINKLSQLDPDLLPENRHYLLEMDFTALTTEHGETRPYWLLTMNVAIMVGHHTTNNKRRATVAETRCRPPAYHPQEGIHSSFGRLVGEVVLRNHLGMEL